MNYQVLARKWRPKNFQQLMGQDHVVSVLVNALAQQRLHHAYLFTGTRGVGKTTIARIFAKSLNCELGVTDQPCGNCSSCLDIDSGRFIDLLEIDAASKTKVDDTREILDNVQYAPTRGRYKVYLIDEVHMLSRHSFNALLKTLEEPPEHVKFILATTDPQKLPITVLSRCLQFHLKALTVIQIEKKLVEILKSEKVTYQTGTLTLLAKSARGSMRDALSLTDQAIAQGKGNVSLANVQQMLGGVDHNWVYKIVIALLKQDSQNLMNLSKEIASYAPSYSCLFADLIQLFHQIALMQLVDQHFDLPEDKVLLLRKFSQAITAEDTQLYYQIALNGRKDLPYAADEQAAFDMTLLRLFAFKPMRMSDIQQQPTSDKTTITERDVNHLPVTEVTQQRPVQNTQGCQEDNAVELPHSVTQSVKENKLNDIVSRQLSAVEISELAEQQCNIEQQAMEMQVSLHDDPKNSSQPIQSVTEIAVQAEDTLTDNEESHQAINNPVSAVLATRNMLRSRKKLLEQQAKKSSDASLRQTHNADSKAKLELSQKEKETLSEPAAPYQQEKIDPAVIKKANQVDKWAHMIDAMELSARIRQLAIHATISEHSTDDRLVLLLDQSTRHLYTEVALQQLQMNISQFLSKKVEVAIELVEQTVADPYQIQSHINDKRFDYAKGLLSADPVIIALQTKFQAILDISSIQAH